MGSPVIFASGQAKCLKPELNFSESGIKTGTFTAANNQSSATNVAGLSFANADIRGAKIQLAVYIDATTDLHEVFDIDVIQKTSSWDISVSSTGDESNINFSITSAGQVQYISGNETGYSSSVFKFTAIALNV